MIFSLLNHFMACFDAQILSNFCTTAFILKRYYETGFFGKDACIQEYDSHCDEGQSVSDYFDFENRFHFSDKALLIEYDVEYDYTKPIRCRIHLKAQRSVEGNQLWRLSLYEETPDVNEYFTFFYTPYTLSHLETSLRDWLHISRLLPLSYMVMHYDFNIQLKIAAIYQKSWNLFLNLKTMPTEKWTPLLFLPPDMLDLIHKMVCHVCESEIKHPRSGPVFWMAPSLSINFFETNPTAKHG